MAVMDDTTIIYTPSGNMRTLFIEAVIIGHAETVARFLKQHVDIYQYVHRGLQNSNPLRIQVQPYIHSSPFAFAQITEMHQRIGSRWKIRSRLGNRE